MSRPRKETKLAKAPEYPQVIETFRKPFMLHNFRQNEPDCFNGVVAVTKYRITIEEIEEPKEVIAERLQKLWDTSDNHHHWQPIRNAAKQIGYELQGRAGDKLEKS